MTINNASVGFIQVYIYVLDNSQTPRAHFQLQKPLYSPRHAAYVVTPIMGFKPRRVIAILCIQTNLSALNVGRVQFIFTLSLQLFNKNMRTSLYLEAKGNNFFLMFNDQFHCEHIDPTHLKIKLCTPPLRKNSMIQHSQNQKSYNNCIVSYILRSSSIVLKSTLFFKQR